MKVVQFLVIFVTFEISYILENALESYRTVFLSGVQMVKSSCSKHL